MSHIVNNVRTADIVVHTPCGVFSFAAGSSVELADDRADAVLEAGKWYFSAGDLVIEEAPAEAPAPNIDAASAQSVGQQQGEETPAKPGKTGKRP